MAKGNGAGLAVVVGAVAVGALFNRKKKNKEEKRRQKDAEQRSAELSSSAITEEAVNAAPSAVSRKCPSCGNIDTSGAANCPICFASMDGKSSSGFEEY